MVDEDYVMRRNAVDFGVPLFMEPRVSSPPPAFCPWVYLVVESCVLIDVADCRPLRPMHERQAAQGRGRAERGTPLERLHRRQAFVDLFVTLHTAFAFLLRNSTFYLTSWKPHFIQLPFLVK